MLKSITGRRCGSDKADDETKAVKVEYCHMRNNYENQWYLA